MQKEPNGSATWLTRIIMVGAAGLVVTLASLVLGYTVSEIRDNTTEIRETKIVHQEDMKKLREKDNILERRIVLDSVALHQINVSLITINESLKDINKKIEDK